MSTPPFSRRDKITRVAIAILVAMLAGTGAGIVMTAMGADARSAVSTGGAAFVAIATVGITVLAFLFS